MQQKNTNVLATSYKYMIVNSLALDKRNKEKGDSKPKKFSICLNSFCHLMYTRPNPTKNFPSKQLGW